MVQTNGCRLVYRHKSLYKKNNYLSVNVFSTAVLIEDTVNRETNIANQTGIFIFVSCHHVRAINLAKSI